MQNKPTKPLLYALFNELENQAKNGDLDSISKNKIIVLNSLINKHLKDYGDKRLNKWLKRSNKYLKAYYNGYLAGAFKTNNPKVKIKTIKRIAPKLLKEYKARNLESVNLISTQNNERMALIKNRLLNWIYAKSNKNKLSSTSLRESVKASQAIAKQDKRFSFILRDQMHKMRGNLDATIANELKAIAFIWNTRKDKRVVGNPSGLYPKASNKKMHGDHFARAGKLYFYHNTYAIKNGFINTKAKGFLWANFADGMPSVPVGCRCTARNIYNLDDIPKRFITEAGQDFIKKNTLY